MSRYALIYKLDSKQDRIAIIDAIDADAATQYFAKLKNLSVSAFSELFEVLLVS